MFAAFNSMFAMFTQLFLGGEKFANAWVHVASVAETKAEAYATKERSKLLQQVIAMDEQPKQLTN